MPKNSKFTKNPKMSFETMATEDDFIEWYRTKDLPTYEKPSVTANAIVFVYDKSFDKLTLLATKRKKHPYQHHYAFPGSFVLMDETSDETILRTLIEKCQTKINLLDLEQLYTFTDVQRDSRTRVISITYLAFVEAEQFSQFLALPHNDENIDFIKLPEIKHINLAFDHNKMLDLALTRIINKMYYEPAKILRLLGSDFTIPQIRRLYAQFLQIPPDAIDNSNLRKKMLPFLQETDKQFIELGNKKPSKCYRLK
ncbi:DNA mismatch repair protein MutT [Erysipelotrichaceae bacterium]|nr:DNA mismatch repair protein MutT [Erysipelotrichaceae bacterium]